MAGRRGGERPGGGARGSGSRCPGSPGGRLELRERPWGVARLGIVLLRKHKSYGRLWRMKQWMPSDAGDEIFILPPRATPHPPSLTQACVPGRCGRRCGGLRAEQPPVGSWPFSMRQDGFFISQILKFCCLCHTIVNGNIWEKNKEKKTHPKPKAPFTNV